ncbi:ABC transporter ATP-binding protein [Prosthecomicrobium sp. N25]|uniref:ABC transporter ATP-binding protein n=1 Tax=Prosthecomicrobium sp. N25 TaxID=3129254 RepID=UPI00307872F8
MTITKDPPKLDVVPEGDPRDRGGPAQPLLIAEDLKKWFPVRGGLLNRAVGHVRAVDGVTFQVLKGETLGIVGESGCGKSTLARLLMQLIPHDSGVLTFDGDPVGEMRGISMKEFRKAVQMVFQDSYSSLNPRLPVEDSVAYGPKVHGMKPAEAKALARELLEKVGLRSNLFGPRYPHELSGGQKQRVNIARALALSPRLLILDEAVSALDKSVEAQVLNLLRYLKRHFNLTYVFISHDLNVVQYISDRVLVMYLGQVVEIGPVDEIYKAPKHPYTRALLASRLSMDPDERVEEAPIAGDPPNPINPPSGCRFRTRCPFAETVCATDTPHLPKWLDATSHVAACHMHDPASGHSRAGKPPAPPVPAASHPRPAAGAQGGASVVALRPANVA